MPLASSDGRSGSVTSTTPEEYLRQSPITYVRDIHTPVLILHSEQDLRCPIEQADQLFVALRMLDREVEYHRFPGESHELSRSGSPEAPGAAGRADPRLLRPPPEGRRRCRARSVGCHRCRFPSGGCAGCAARRRCAGSWPRPGRVDDLIAPLFVREGISEPQPIASLPGVVQHTRESLRRR